MSIERTLLPILLLPKSEKKLLSNNFPKPSQYCRPRKKDEASTWLILATAVILTLAEEMSEYSSLIVYMCRTSRENFSCSCTFYVKLQFQLTKFEATLLKSRSFSCFSISSSSSQERILVLLSPLTMRKTKT